MWNIPLCAQSAPDPSAGDGVMQRALQWLKNWMTRRQGHYVPEEPTDDGWHGRGGHERHRRGWRAEEYTAKRLWSMGYHVLERNVRVGRWEIDIVAQQGDTLVFVEVKSGRDNPDRRPRQHVDGDKRHSLLAAGQA